MIVVFFFSDYSVLQLNSGLNIIVLLTVLIMIWRRNWVMTMRICEKLLLISFTVCWFMLSLWRITLQNFPRMKLCPFAILYLRIVSYWVEISCGGGLWHACTVFDTFRICSSRKWRISAKSKNEFPSSGYMRDTSGHLITKHDKEIAERRNSEKVMHVSLYQIKMC